LGLYEKAMPGALSLNEKLAETKNAGFDFMEISIDESDEKLSRLKWTSAERHEIKALVESTETPIATMCLSGHRKYPIGSLDPRVRERGLEIMVDAVDLAFDLGVRIIQLAGYDEYYNPSTAETRRLFSENLRRCVYLASRKGIILAFETMETPFMNTVAKAMDHVRAVDSPYLQVYPDLGNITNAAIADGRSVDDDLESGRGHIAAMHLKETKPGIFRDMDFGTGHVDFSGGARKAASLGVRLFVGEFWHVDVSDWRSRISGAGRFLRQVLDSCFEKD